MVDRVTVIQLLLEKLLIFKQNNVSKTILGNWWLPYHN